MQSRNRKLIMSLVLATSVLAARADQLLDNPGFETGDFTGWTVGGTATSGVAAAGTPIPGAFQPNVVGVHGGNFAAWGDVAGSCCTTPVPLDLSQSVNVVAGSDYSIGFYLYNGSASSVGYDTGDASNTIEIYVNGTALLPTASHTVCPDCLVPGSWYLFSGNWNSGGATTADVTFQIVASGTEAVGVSVDDAFVEGAAPSMPEPSAFVLFAGSLCALVVFAKRQAARCPTAAASDC